MGSSPAVAKDQKPPDASGFSTETGALFPGAEHEVRPPEPRAFPDVKRVAAPAVSSLPPGIGPGAIRSEVTALDGARSGGRPRKFLTLEADLFQGHGIRRRIPWTLEQSYSRSFAPSLLCKQHRREFVQVVAPVDPGMAAF